MTKHLKTGPARARALDFMHGGQMVRQDLLKRYFNDAERKKVANLREKVALHSEAAKYRSKLQNFGAKNLGASAEAKRALAGLQGITERLTKRKVLAPTVIPQPSGIIAGSYTEIFTPPYQYSYQSARATSGKPVVSASADKTAGQMKNVAISNPKSPSQAYAESDIGIYFAPTFARGVATVSVNPSIEYSWWINVRTDLDAAASQGAISLGVGFYSPSELRLSQRKAVPQFFEIWGEILMGQLDFGFGSIPSYPLQLSIPVTDEYVYLFFVGIDAQADADGWPTSLAGGKLAVTVPSFTVYAQPIPQTR